MEIANRRIHFTLVCVLYLSDKDPEEQQCEVPCEEQETGTDPQVVEEGQIKQSCHAVKRVDWTGDQTMIETHRL